MKTNFGMRPYFIRSQWPRGLRPRLHWSQNRHNTANQNLSGYTSQARVATFNPTCLSRLLATQGLLVPRFFFTWRSSETPSLNSSLPLPLIETSAEALSSSRFGVQPRAESSAASTFDCVGRGIITAFTNDIDVKYRHFDSRVVPATWSHFVSHSFPALSDTISRRFPCLLHLFNRKKNSF
jgi:hypothetical protein